MPPACPREFVEDVIRVARNREPGVRLIDIAKEFGIFGSCLSNWLKHADVEDGIKPGMASDDRAENRELKKRLRLLEQPFTNAELDEAWLANTIFDAHTGDPEFGYRFLADKIGLIGENADVSDRVVWRICCDMG